MEPWTGKRLPVLDGVRGLAILFVLVGHFCYAKNPAIGNFIGSSGVSLFFVLSGYLITRILVADEIRFQRVRLLRFYLRRAVRILPALLVFLMCLDVFANFGMVKQLSPETWAASLFYFRNFSGDGWDSDLIQFSPPVVIWKIPVFRLYTTVL
jgi:peptidoglycan/LPS O-acetylase OafA/YrhL